MSDKKKRPGPGRPEERLNIEGDPANALDRLLAKAKAEARSGAVHFGHDYTETWQEGDTPIDELHALATHPRLPAKVTIAGNTDWVVVTSVTGADPVRVTYVPADPPK